MGHDVEGTDATFSHIEESTASLAAGPQLFLQLECDRPFASPIQFSLADVDEVHVGRGDRQHTREASGGIRRLTVKLSDGWMSSRHARLWRQGDRFSVEDLASKNGTVVNGTPVVGPTVLGDGDLLEVGHALFLFRQSSVRLEGSPVDQEAHDLSPEAPELATFASSLAQQVEGLARVAPLSDIPILILGETGTGKEIMARAVHRLSRRSGDFVAVNCGALPATLLEAELFGYRKGAFSGATEDRLGLVRAADGGTLFLDEIGDLAMSSQVALLRILEEKEVLPLGATRPVKVNLRVVTATHREIPVMVEKGSFRADLFARLAGYRVYLPPLRDRVEDLGLLIGRLLSRSGPSAERVTLSPRAARSLFRYGWPMNIRELGKCLTAAVALADGAAIDLKHLPEDVRQALSRPTRPPSAPPPVLSEEDRERRQVLVALLAEHQGNVTRVANAMGKAPMQIHRWLRRYAINLREFRKG